jgi:spermidine/putrescine transport system substrate-binding protein
MKRLSYFSKLRGLLILLTLITFTIFNSCKETDQKRSTILKIYNWADYIDEDLLEEFPIWYKEQTGEDVRIVYQVFDMTEVMYTKIALGKEDFDLVCPTQAIIERMMENNLLLPFEQNLGNTPNFIGNISPFIAERLEAFSKENKAANNFVGNVWNIIQYRVYLF